MRNTMMASDLHGIVQCTIRNIASAKIHVYMHALIFIQSLDLCNAVE
jgi:hypothetical protein